KGAREHRSLVDSAGAVAPALVGHEPEEVVLEDRSAHRASVEILVEWRPIVILREVAAQVHEGVAIVLKRASVELVRTRLDDLVDDRAAVAGELRIDGAGDDVFF